MLMLKMPEEMWRIRLCRMICSESFCPFTRYDSFVKRNYICNPKKALFVRRSKIDKNGRVYSIHNSKWKCVIRILEDYNDKHSSERYASSEIKYMKKVI